MLLIGHYKTFNLNVMNADINFIQTSIVFLIPIYVF